MSSSFYVNLSSPSGLGPCDDFATPTASSVTVGSNACDNKSSKQGRSASERDLLSNIRPTHKQQCQYNRSDRTFFTLPRFTRVRSGSGFTGAREDTACSRFSSEIPNAADVSDKASQLHQSLTSIRSSRSCERRSLLKSIARSLSVKRPTRKDGLSFSNGDLSKSVSTPKSDVASFNSTLKGNSQLLSKRSANLVEDFTSEGATDWSTGEQTSTGAGVAGLTGLRNHGNTCYLNAIVQCLSNTDAFAEYFVLNRYVPDLACARKANRSKKRHGSSRGELTEQLALLIKSLWDNNAIVYSDISARFKNTVGKFGSHYAGAQQHDAQEFLIWLLDTVHEDLNRASKTKYKKLDPKETPAFRFEDDETLAARALANHIRCNSSFIQELFVAQTKLTVSCPLCRKQCRTFDPYVCLSLPIPLRMKRVVPVRLIAFSENGNEHQQMEMAIDLFDDSTVSELREQIANRCNLPAQQLLLVQLLPDSATMGGFGPVYADSDPIASLLEDINFRGSSRFVTCLKMPTPKKTSQESEHIMIIWQNRTVLGGVFGPPFVIQVKRDVSFEELRGQMLDAMKDIICLPKSVQSSSDIQCYSSVSTDLLLPGQYDKHEMSHIHKMDELDDCHGSRKVLSLSTTSNASFHQRYSNSTENRSNASIKYVSSVAPSLATVFPLSSFSIICADMLPERNELRPGHDLPLYTDFVEHITAVSKVQYPSIVKHLRLVVEWKDEAICELLLEPPCPLQDESLRRLDQEDRETSSPVDLNDCLDAYFSEELLEADEAWLCPTCERRRQVLSKLELWTTPEILFIHLKRFKQVNHQRSKIAALVQFPLGGLNLSRYAATSTQQNQCPSDATSQSSSSSCSSGVGDKVVYSANRQKHCPGSKAIGTAPASTTATLFTWSPWRNNTISQQRLVTQRPHAPSDSTKAVLRKSTSFTYDLYAVCNHHGSMQAGHYTAFCKNPINGLWYHFDDTQVTSVVRESDVVTCDAYILFYQRTASNVPQSCSSSSSGYSSSSSSSGSNEVPRHWSSKKEPFHHTRASSNSFDNLYDEDSSRFTFSTAQRTLRDGKHFGASDWSMSASPRVRDRRTAPQSSRIADMIPKFSKSSKRISLDTHTASYNVAEAHEHTNLLKGSERAQKPANSLSHPFNKRTQTTATHCSVTSV